MTAEDGSTSRPFSYADCACGRLRSPTYAAPRREWPLPQSLFSSMHLFASSKAFVNSSFDAYAPERLE